MKTLMDEDLDKMTDAQTIDLFLVNYVKFKECTPKVKENVAKGYNKKTTPQADTSEDNIYEKIVIKILSKWQSAPRLTIDPSLEGSAANGRYWAQLLVKHAIRVGSLNVLLEIADFFKQMQYAIERELGSMSMKGVKEYEEVGRASWFWIQRMDSQFFCEAYGTIQNILEEPWESRPKREARRKEVGGGESVTTDGRNRLEAEGAYDSHGIGKAARGRDSVALNNGMVGAPGSVSLSVRMKGAPGLATPSSGMVEASVSASSNGTERKTQELVTPSVRKKKAPGTIKLPKRYVLVPGPLPPSFTSETTPLPDRAGLKSDPRGRLSPGYQKTQQSSRQETQPRDPKH